MPASRRLSGPPSFRAMLAQRFNELAEELGEDCAIMWSPLRGFIEITPSYDEAALDGCQRSPMPEAEVYRGLARMTEEAEAMRRAESREVAAVPARAEG